MLKFEQLQNCKYMDFATLVQVTAVEWNDNSIFARKKNKQTIFVNNDWDAQQWNKDKETVQLTHFTAYNE